MSLQVNGKITKILEKESGTSKTGKEWVKQSFIIDSGEQYNNLYCFEVFGSEKVENLSKYNKVGDEVSVEFNVSCNEWQGKYFTSLQAWKITKSNNNVTTSEAFETISESELNTEDKNDLPF